mmetsp:Transcript_4883/g.14131  ORF Transcript_4883/g.14131 Transcript_4883/m.14131 type:complete len:217 (-) Transcript_4883:406-1056(-)
MHFPGQEEGSGGGNDKDERAVAPSRADTVPAARLGRRHHPGRRDHVLQRPSATRSAARRQGSDRRSSGTARSPVIARNPGDVGERLGGQPTTIKHLRGYQRCLQAASAGRTAEQRQRCHRQQEPFRSRQRQREQQRIRPNVLRRTRVRCCRGVRAILPALCRRSRQQAGKESNCQGRGRRIRQLDRQRQRKAADRIVIDEQRQLDSISDGWQLVRR